MLFVNYLMNGKGKRLAVGRLLIEFICWIELTAGSKDLAVSNR
jgi:hypothetical protein